MRDLVKSFAAVAWRSVFPRRAKPAKTEVPDLALPQVEDGVGEQSFTAGMGLAVPQVEDDVGEQSFAAGVERQHNSGPLEDASSVKITKVWLKWHIRKS